MREKEELGPRSFDARSWFVPGAQEVAQATRAPSPRPEAPKRGFSPSAHLTLGWKGEGLSSGPVVKLQGVIHQLCRDAQKQFLTFNTRNRSFKHAIYGEFHEFFKQFGQQAQGPNSYEEFWQHLLDKDSPHQGLIRAFTELAPYRAVAIYLYKLRLVLEVHSVHRGEALAPSDILNLNGLLCRTFKKGSNLDFHCEALGANPYSWYRPHQSYAHDLLRAISLLRQIFFEDLAKIIDVSVFCPKFLALLGPAQEDSLRSFDRSFGQAPFGALVNDLIIKFPIWLKKKSFQPSKLVKARKVPLVVRTKFFGDQLMGLAQGHWQAQMERISFEYNDLICPDFVNDGPLHGSFTRCCQELEFMFFLLLRSKKYGNHPLAILAEVMRRKYSRDLSGAYDQVSFLGTLENRPERKYDRIVVNVANLSRKNPHHYLLTQINKQARELNDGGAIIIFSGQRLFLPGQSDKLKQLSQLIKIEAHFDMTELKGKGEAPNFIYVATKRPPREKSPHGLRESCLTFRWKGELTSFLDLRLFVRELNTFFENKGPLSANIYQKKMDKDFTFQLYQDTLLEGKLVSRIPGPTAQGGHSVAHPHFIENMARSCWPLSHFFHIKTLQEAQSENSPSHLLGIPLNFEERYPWAMVVDDGDPQQTQIHLVPSADYEQRASQWEAPHYQCFALSPKVQGLNFAVFREYFESSIGHQVLQLSLRKKTSRAKSYLKGILIPQFFCPVANPEGPWPEAMDELVNFWASPHVPGPEARARRGSAYLKMEKIALHSSAQTPHQVLAFLSAIKSHIGANLKKLKIGPQDNPFCHPIIVKRLLALKKIPLHPNHPDLFVQIDHPQGPITGLSLKERSGQHGLQIHSHETPAGEVYGPRILLEFLEYVMGPLGLSSPLGHVLPYIEIPTHQSLQEVLELHQGLLQEFQKFHQNISRAISEHITKQFLLPPSS